MQKGFGRFESYDFALRFSKEIWNRVFSLFEIMGAVNERWADFVLISWHFKSKFEKTKWLWRITLLATAWHSWLERNRRIFENKVGSVEDLWARIKFTIGLWAKAANVFNIQIDFCLV